jgi:CubicO group peptidase (beta-lactamase class C family)
MKRPFEALVLLLLLALPDNAAGQPVPDATWTRANPAALGWSVEKLADAERYATGVGATAVMVVHHGMAIATWGDVTAKVQVASIRKSLLSALYGIAVADGRIDLRRTLNELDIDDREPALTDTEKTAAIRDLLMARSGVYHAAAYETPDMAAKRPARGSHPPGAFWYYNNWDFNALGSIYERLVGTSIFESFDRAIARPIGMEDYRTSDGIYVRAPTSDHAAYVFALSARDLARFGLLFLRKGSWKNRRIIPEAWIGESTTVHSTPADYGLDYGYMWWRTSTRTDAWSSMGTGAYLALGYGGQILAVSPSRNLIVVLLANPENRRALRIIDAADLLRRIVAASP